MPQIKKLLLSPQFTLIVWAVVALVGGLLKYSLGPGSYNNYLIFCGTSDHFFAQMPLYAPYPSEYDDVNHYGLVFGMLMTPFAVLPDWLGVPLWCFISTMALYFAIKKLPISGAFVAVVCWVAVNDLFGAVAMQQFNILSAAMVVATYVAVQKRREGLAALFIVLGTFVKIYGVVGLVFWLFAERKWRMILYGLLWTALVLITPLIFVEWDYVSAQYSAWSVDIAQKSLANQFAHLQNLSFIGFLRKTSGAIAMSDMTFVAVAVGVFCGTLLRWRQWAARNYQLMTLASLLIFLVIFSNGSENSTYVIASVGVGLWFVITKKRGPLQWALLGLVLVASFARNLMPIDVYHSVFVRYALRSLPYTAVWLATIIELYGRNFAKDNDENKMVEPEPAQPIDVVLPCYNPMAGWSGDVIHHFGALRETYSYRELRLFLSNDGSTSGFHPEVQRVVEAFPAGVVNIVDNLVNQGKGGAVRAGVSATTAPMIIYTDYDFPYRSESLREVISKLDQGYDIVLAARNHSYHGELSPMRRALSWVSKNMNFLLLGMPFPDAQGGLKGFNASVGKHIFLSTKIKRFLFDTEFIYKASKMPHVRVSQINADLREGIHLPAMSRKTMRREAINFLRIIFSV